MANPSAKPEAILAAAWSSSPKSLLKADSTAWEQLKPLPNVATAESALFIFCLQ
jgi:hypothetical protein